MWSNLNCQHHHSSLQCHMILQKCLYYVSYISYNFTICLYYNFTKCLSYISYISYNIRWWVGGWQTCSATCGPNGVKKRTVLCIRTVAGEERVLHPGDCKQLLKPKPVVPCNRDVTCGFEWTVGNWSEVDHFIINYPGSCFLCSSLTSLHSLTKLLRSFARYFHFLEKLFFVKLLWWK